MTSPPPLSMRRQRISANENIHHGAWLHSVMLQFEDMFRVGQRIRMSIFGLLDWFRRKGIEERTCDRFSPSRVARAQDSQRALTMSIHDRSRRRRRRRTTTARRRTAAAPTTEFCLGRLFPTIKILSLSENQRSTLRTRRRRGCAV
jgi:hypothetical protein